MDLEDEIKLISRDLTKIQNRLFVIQRIIAKQNYRIQADGILEFDDPILKGVGHC